MPVIEKIEDLNLIVREMEAHFGDLHKEVDHDEKYYNLDFKDELDMPTEFQDSATVLPTARSNVDAVVDHVSPESRSVEVAAISDSTSAQANAQKQQRFYEALLNWLEGEFDQSPYRQGVKRLGMIGIDVWKFIPVPGPRRPKQRRSESNDDFEDRLEQWKIHQFSTMPFRLIPVHPTEVFFDPFNPTPKWAVEHKEMLVGEVQSIYPDWGNPRNRKITDRVEVDEFWSETERAVVIDNQSALKGGDVVPHKWGTHPYIIGASGYGVDDMEHRMENRYVSINRFIRDVLHSESRNYSVVDVVLKAQAWPIRIATGSRANEIPNLDLKYGQVHPFPDGVKIDDLNPSLPHEMVSVHQNQASRVIADVAAPRSVRGLREPGTTSGIDQQTQLGEARLKYRPIAFGVQRMLTQVCEKAAIYMRTTIKEPVSIRPGATTDDIFEVSSRMFRSPLPVLVKVNVLDPEDEVRKKNAMAQELAAGTIDQLSAIKELHPDMDARKIQRRVSADRMMNHPIIQQVIAAALAEGLTQKLELEELLEAAVERIALQEQQDAAAGQATPPASTDGGVIRGDRRDQAADRQLDGRLG